MTSSQKSPTFYFRLGDLCAIQIKDVKYLLHPCSNLYYVLSERTLPNLLTGGGVIKWGGGGGKKFFKKNGGGG